MMNQDKVKSLLFIKEEQLVHAETDYQRVNSKYGRKSLITINFKSIRDGIRRECNILRQILKG